MVSPYADPDYKARIAWMQEHCDHLFTEGAIQVPRYDPVRRTFGLAPVLRRICLKCDKVIDQSLRSMPLKPLLGGPPTFTAPGKTTDVQRWGDLVITEKEY